MFSRILIKSVHGCVHISKGFAPCHQPPQYPSQPDGPWQAGAGRFFWMFYMTQFAFPQSAGHSLLNLWGCHLRIAQNHCKDFLGALWVCFCSRLTTCSAVVLFKDRLGQQHVASQACIWSTSLIIKAESGLSVTFLNKTISQQSIVYYASTP